MRLNLTSNRLGVPIYVGPNVFIIKTLVAIGGGAGKLSHKGFRRIPYTISSLSDFLKISNKSNNENILQILGNLCNSKMQK